MEDPLAVLPLAKCIKECIIYSNERINIQDKRQATYPARLGEETERGAHHEKG
jgi:hypothetical protein